MRCCTKQSPTHLSERPTQPMAQIYSPGHPELPNLLTATASDIDRKNENPTKEFCWEEANVPKHELSFKGLDSNTRTVWHTGLEIACISVLVQVKVELCGYFYVYLHQWYTECCGHIVNWNKYFLCDFCSFSEECVMLRDIRCLLVIWQPCLWWEFVSSGDRTQPLFLQEKIPFWEQIKPALLTSLDLEHLILYSGDCMVLWKPCLCIHHIWIPSVEFVSIASSSHKSNLWFTIVKKGLGLRLGGREFWRCTSRRCCS